MSSYGYKSHVLMIFNQLTSYVEDVLKSYILKEILLVTISMLKSSLFAKRQLINLVTYNLVNKLERFLSSKKIYRKKN